MTAPLHANQVLTRVYDAGADALRTTGGGSSGTADVKVIGPDSVQLARHDYVATPVTTAAYEELVAALSDDVNQLYIFDSSGRTLFLAVGGVGSEVDKAYIVPGGNGILNLRIATGSRVSIKAIGSTANKGELSVTFLK